MRGVHGTWPDGEGVVEFPNGVRIRGRRLRRAAPGGRQPEYGVYLAARQPPAESWPVDWIKWPDFRLPADPPAAIGELASALARARDQRVEIGCPGGRGRTGTALAVMAVLAGVDRTEAVDWVRVHYHPRAVETPGQRRWIRNLDIGG